MKNYKLILGILVTMLALTACGDGLATEVVDEEEFTLTNIEFINNDNWWKHEFLVEIETDGDYLVFDNYRVSYIKDEYYSENSKVTVRKIKDDILRYDTATIYLSEEDAKEYSKKYAKEFEETIKYGYKY